MRSCSSLVLMKRSTKEVASAHAGSASLAGQGRTGRWAGRLQPKRSVWTVLVLVPDVDPQDLLEVTAADDQQPIKALGADGPHPSLRIGVGVGRLHRRDQHLGVFRAEHVIEPAAELRVTIADQEAHAASLVLQAQQQVACLLGDPGGVGIGGHPGQVNPASAEFDEEQDVEPSQPDGVDGEEVAGEDPGGLLVQERPPGGGRPPWRRVQSVAAQRGADRGRRDAQAKLEQLALGALVAPARVLAGQANDQLLQFLVEWRASWSAVRVGPGAGDQAPCQRSSVSGFTKKHDQRERGSARLSAASTARSAGWSLGRATWRRSTASWWRSTRISRFLAVSPRASRTGSWMERQSVR